MKVTVKNLQDIIQENIREYQIQLNLYLCVRKALDSQDGKKITKRFEKIVEAAILDEFTSGIFKPNQWRVNYNTNYGMYHIELNVRMPNRESDYTMSILLSHDNEFTMEKLNRNNTCYLANIERLEQLKKDYADTDKLKLYVKHTRAMIKAREFFESMNEYDKNNCLHYDFKKKMLGE